jgi:hypothetical protein
MRFDLFIFIYNVEKEYDKSYKEIRSTNIVWMIKIVE